jgi:hypothetical protein
MATSPSVDRTETIARLNDRARLGLDPRARITFTRNCLAAFCDPDAIVVVAIQAQLMAAFRNCAFAEDSPERDFGTVEFRGRKVWLKIDLYEDPNVKSADGSTAITRVITIMLPSDY